MLYTRCICVVGSVQRIRMDFIQQFEAPGIRVKKLLFSMLVCWTFIALIVAPEYFSNQTDVSLKVHIPQRRHHPFALHLVSVLDRSDDWNH